MKSIFFWLVGKRFVNNTFKMIMYIVLYIMQCLTVKLVVFMTC